MRPEASPIELTIGRTHFYSKKKANNVITFYNINIFTVFIYISNKSIAFLRSYTDPKRLTY